MTGRRGGVVFGCPNPCAAPASADETTPTQAGAVVGSEGVAVIVQLAPLGARGSLQACQRLLVIEGEHHLWPGAAGGFQEGQRRPPSRVEFVAHPAVPTLGQHAVTRAPLAAPVLPFPVVARRRVAGRQNCRRDGQQAVEAQRLLWRSRKGLAPRVAADRGGHKAGDGFRGADNLQTIQTPIGHDVSPLLKRRAPAALRRAPAVKLEHWPAPGLVVLGQKHAS